MTVMKVTQSQRLIWIKHGGFGRRLVASPWLKYFAWTLKQRFCHILFPFLAPYLAVIANMVINGLDFSTGWLWAWTCSGCCTGQDELLSITETSSPLFYLLMMNGHGRLLPDLVPDLVGSTDQKEKALSWRLEIDLCDAAFFFLLLMKWGLVRHRACQASGLCWCLFDWNLVEGEIEFEFPVGEMSQRKCVCVSIFVSSAESSINKPTSWCSCVWLVDMKPTDTDWFSKFQTGVKKKKNANQNVRITHIHIYTYIYLFTYIYNLQDFQNKSWDVRERDAAEAEGALVLGVGGDVATVSVPVEMPGTTVELETALNTPAGRCAIYYIHIQYTPTDI